MGSRMCEAWGVKYMSGKKAWLPNPTAFRAEIFPNFLIILRIACQNEEVQLCTKHNSSCEQAREAEEAFPLPDIRSLA